MARKKKNSKSVRIDLSNVGKGFEANSEYLIEVEEATLEEGDNGPYFSLKLKGTDEFDGAAMYHNASCSEKALWRFRPLLEAFDIDIPEGPMDISADDFVGRQAMCSTFKDTYNGKVSIKADDFWPAEEGAGGDSGGDEVEIDLDDIEDDDIKKLGRKLKIKTRSVKKIKEEIEENIDDGDLMEALEALGLIEEDGDGDEGDGDEGDEVDLDDLSDADIKKLGKAAGIKGRVVKKIKAALEELDEDDLNEAMVDAGLVDDEEDEEEEEKPKGKKGKKGKKAPVTEDAIGEMGQDELEALVEQHDLDVDLDDFKTLRKKRVAVVDAAEEAEVLED